MKITQTLMAVMLGTAAVTGASFQTPASAETADTAAYEAFGGKEGIDRVVADLVPRIFENPQIGPFFKDSSQDRLHKMLAEQFCAELSGPCKYTGQGMKQVHSRFDIRREHFNILVEELQVSMDRQHVPFWAQGKLLARLAPMYRDIIDNGDKVPKR